VVARDEREWGAKEDARVVRRRTSPMWPLGIFALIIGAVLWPIGANYTLDGWIAFLNLILRLIRIPFTVPSPAGWMRLYIGLPIAFVYSQAEVRVRVGLPASFRLIPQWILAVLLVLCVHGSDVLTTFLGYFTPAPDAWPIHLWAVKDGLWALILWVIVLTYGPERAMILGDEWIGRPFGRFLDALGQIGAQVWMSLRRKPPRYSRGSGE
jgi:hypothetical protein